MCKWKPNLSPSRRSKTRATSASTWTDSKTSSCTMRNSHAQSASSVCVAPVPLFKLCSSATSLTLACANSSSTAGANAQYLPSIHSKNSLLLAPHSLPRWMLKLCKINLRKWAQVRQTRQTKQTRQTTKIFALVLIWNLTINASPPIKRLV